MEYAMCRGREYKESKEPALGDLELSQRDMKWMGMPAMQGTVV